jgi:hypothetical protein
MVSDVAQPAAFLSDSITVSSRLSALALFNQAERENNPGRVRNHQGDSPGEAGPLPELRVVE